MLRFCGRCEICNMNGRRDRIRTHRQDRAQSPARARRSVAAILVSVFVYLIQIGPALACDVFDRPDGACCPALFHDDPVDQFGSDDHGRAPEDCSRGPSYLALDVQPIEAYPTAGGDDHVVADRWGLAAAHDLFASLQNIGALRATAHRATAHERYVYLRTLRLRL